MYRPKINPGGGFPDQFASDEEKNSEDYGLRVGQAIESEWFNGVSGTRYGTQRTEFIKRRLYARGNQPVEKYKNELAINGDISYLNLDWTPVPIIPKYVDVIVNGIQGRSQSVKVEAIDDFSSMERESYKNDLEVDMHSKDMLKMVKDKTGVNAFSVNEEDVPDNMEELDLFMRLRYKQKIEIAEETAIETVFQLNDYEEMKRRCDEDATVLGVSVGKHSFDVHNGVKLDYVDPVDFVYSPTEDPNFRDCYYFGEVKRVHVSELKKINPYLSQTELNTISKLASKYDSNRYGNNSTTNSGLDDALINLMYFSYKTDAEIVYKIKNNDNGGQKPIEKDSNFNPPESEESRYTKASRRIDVWYEGVMVLGTDTLLKWKLMDNMVRPKSAFQNVIPPYIVSAIKLSKGNIDSLVKRMIPFADQIQLTHLKLQQVVAKMIPDGVFIDADGLNSVDLGNGASYNPSEALSMYFQTGSVIGRSYTEDGEQNAARVPIQELTSSGSNAKIASLINMYNYQLNMIRAVTGINEAVDASLPDKNSLVGIQKLAANNSNTATRHVVQSGVKMTQRMAECISYRISDIIQYSDFAEDFAKMIGKNNMSVVREIMSIHLRDFGVFIEIEPDSEEKAMLEQNIQQSIAAKIIDIEDAMDIRSVNNYNLANQLLKIKKSKKAKEDLANKKANIDMQTNANIQSSNAASQSRAQELQMKIQLESQLEQLKAQLNDKKMERELFNQSELLRLKYSLEAELNNQKSIVTKSIEEAKEDGKNKRIDKQASNASKMITQRKEESQPINFEQEDDKDEIMCNLMEMKAIE